MKEHRQLLRKRRAVCVQPGAKGKAGSGLEGCAGLTVEVHTKIPGSILKGPQKSLNKKSHYKVGSRVPRVGTIC